MSLDQTQLNVPNATAPTLDTNSLIVAAVTPVAQQVATQVAEQLHQGSLQLIGDLTSRVTANEQAIQDAVGRAGSGLLHGIETDSKTQQIIIGGIVAGLILGALIVLVAYLNGNPQAAKVIAGVPAVAVGLALWVSKVGITLPKPAAKTP